MQNAISQSPRNITVPAVVRTEKACSLSGDVRMYEHNRARARENRSYAPDCRNGTTLRECNVRRVLLRGGDGRPTNGHKPHARQMLVELCSA